MAIRIYWVVYADGAGKPSNDQIRLGQNSGGTAALEAGDAPYTTGGILTFPPVITVLTPNTAYQEAFVAYDDVALTYSNSVESVTITTEVITPISVSVNESFTLTTIENASSTKSGTTTESVTVTDSQNATVVTGPVTHSVNVNEFVTVTDSQNASVSGSVVNPPWENVVLLLHADGTNNSISFVDSSQYNWPVTAVNGGVISTTDPKFGTGALKLPGYVSVPDNAIFDFGIGDFTIELQVHVPAGSGNYGAFFGWQNGGVEFWLGVAFTGGNLQINWPSGGNVNTSTGFLRDNYSWVVFSRASGVFAAWVDLELANVNSTALTTPFNPTVALQVGASNSGGALPAGYVDEVRITKGIALYTQAAPPTVIPTTPYPNGPQLVSGTVAESITLTDSQNATVTAGIISVSVHESLTLSDSQNATATYRKQVDEGVTLLDSQNARSTLQASRSESITLSATQDATKQSPQVIPVTVSELITLIAQQDAYIPGKPDRRVGRFGDPIKKGIQEAERAMIELEDEFILEIVLSLAVKGAIA